MDGHAVQGGGIIVDSGNFDWTKGDFPELTEPDESYHGIVYTETYGKLAYILKARMQLMRDFGCYPAAQSAFYLNLGLETLPVRMERYCANARKVAEFFKTSDKIAKVTYPGLPGDKYYERAQKYMPDGTCGVISFGVKGGRSSAEEFMKRLKLAIIATHVADAHTCVLHPASSTHRQMTDEELLAGGIKPDMIRLSVGIENVQDIIDDLSQALNA
jgi:O-acetylhomoserine (thiol)-lyase